MSYRLVFNGTPIMGSDKVQGELFWEDTFSNGSVRYTGRWEAVAGSRTLIPIPYSYDQHYSVSNHRDRTEGGYVRDDVGFTFDITPLLPRVCKLVVVHGYSFQLIADYQ